MKVLMMRAGSDSGGGPGAAGAVLMGWAPDGIVLGCCGILPEAVAVAGPGVAARAGMSAGSAASPSIGLDKM
jgi:hypothetical protein